VPAMTRALQALDADEGLRNELVVKGLVQARKFTPENYQQRLIELYRHVGVQSGASV